MHHATQYHETYNYITHLSDVDTESTTMIAPFDGSLQAGRAFQYDSEKRKNPNSFSRLSDAQIAMILIAIIVIVIAITAFVVRQCVIEKRKKIFGEFVDNLPSAMEVDVSIVVARRHRRRFRGYFEA